MPLDLEANIHDMTSLEFLAHVLKGEVQMDRAKHVHAPEDSAIGALCERLGYGAVIGSAARLWSLKDPEAAFVIAGCRGTVKPALAELQGKLTELTATRAILADALAEVRGLREEQRPIVEDVEWLLGLMEGSYRGVGWIVPAQTADKIADRFLALYAKMRREGKPTADTPQAQIDALAEVARLQRENARLHNAGLTLLGIVSELHKSLFYEHTEPQNYTEPPEIVDARAALEGKHP